MALVILQLDGGVELRTTDRTACRVLYRLMQSAVSNAELEAVVTDDPVPIRPLLDPSPDVIAFGGAPINLGTKGDN